MEAPGLVGEKSTIVKDSTAPDKGQGETAVRCASDAPECLLSDLQMFAVAPYLLPVWILCSIAHTLEEDFHEDPCLLRLPVFRF